MKKNVIILVFTLSVFTGAVAQNTNKVMNMPVLYRIEGQEKARVQRDIVYKTVGKKDLKMDIYKPAEVGDNELLPAVISISGSSEMKHWRVFTDYGKLVSAAGMISIQYNKRMDGSNDGIICNRMFYSTGSGSDLCDCTRVSSFSASSSNHSM